MITRCVLPALKRAADLPMDQAAFRALIAEFPEVCPHTDCSPGAGCRAAVADPLRGVWVQRRGRK